MLPHALIVLEATGRYEQALLSCLLDKNYAVHRASGTQTSAFIRSLRLHGKTDAADAVALARYAYERGDTLPLTQIPNETQQILETFLARREDLLAMRVAEQQRVQHPRYTLCRDQVQRVLEFLHAEIAAIEQDIDELFADHPP